MTSMQNYGLRQLTAPLGLRSQTASCGQHLSLWPFLPGHSFGRPFGQTPAGSQVTLPGGAVVPSGHSVQMTLPALSLKESAGHGVHWTLPEVAAKEPAGHAVHAALPVVLAKDPGRHAAHVVLPGAAAN